MKKHLCIFFAFLLLFPFVLIGCKRSNRQEDTTSPSAHTSTDGTTNERQTTNTKKSDETTVPSDLTYTYTTVRKETIIDKNTQSDKILIYPQFSGFADSQKEEALNDYIVQVCESQFDAILPNLQSLLEQEAYVGYKTEAATVTSLTSNLVSITFRGTLRVSIPFETLGNREFFYTMNIDLDTLEELTSDRIVNDFDVLKNKFLSGEFEQIGGLENIAQKTPLTDLMMRYRSDYGIYPEYYFTRDMFCMNIEVPAEPGWLIQYAQFAMPISEAAAYLSTANTAINALISAANR